MGLWINPSGENCPATPPDSRNEPSLNQVERYLKQAHECIRNGRFVVLDGDPEDESNTRNKNRRFMTTYGLTDVNRQKRFLLSVDPQDFCHIKYTNDGRELYVFCVERELQRPLSVPEKIAVYVKHDFKPGVSKRNIIVSLHPIEHSIYLPFRD